ncbi:RagB/SusD family nutrient uptake outer membrane protein [Pedobacter sp. MC2016-24]|uniref:RagB/SusD family nutrient uptake outer membrane protein n=1 Tax=Pedobacter sp. MC2016-24 TaxID=2780090 RepID=UPI00188149AE|nr:RagB/SusD family nutrient uptake outer membrane protein [Pedobacter sp. MC2016-24]MBE9602591.1 RagB/SusD family nutrient uptake outer membrane protein [Pedobacter sp. MC2016-24]
MKKLYKNNEIWKFLMLIALIILNYSCKKLIEIDAPVNEIIGSKVFNSEASVDAALNGLYITFRNQFDGSIGFLPSFSSDELNDNAGGFISFNTNRIGVDDGFNSAIWKNSYDLIYQSNSIIEGVQLTSFLSVGKKNQLLGEAKFMRAFNYFELVNFYGDVPLITATDVRITSIAARTSIDLVYKQIITDLKDAQFLLDDSYLGPDRSRVNRSAANALLARVYLYKQEYGNAEIQATNVINNASVYQIETLSNLFLKSSKETIFQIANVNGYTNLAQTFIANTNPVSLPNCSFTDDFISAFEPSDQRKMNWISVKTIKNTPYFYPYKYKKLSSSVNLQPECLIVLRLAEQYLIRAEARVMQGKLTEGRDDLNVTRRRAGLLDNTQVSKEELLLAIEKEKRIELCVEFGHRWFDLKRTKRADQILSLVKSAWKPTAALYPIPLIELNNNPNLTPNPGY